MPLAVIDPDGASSTTYYVHADHLNRPIAMTNSAKAFVARFTWLPHGGLHSYTGAEGIDLRFPGQLYQAESGLHYNWYRQYDPTTGRYTQPDPLGLIDGPSRYAYVTNDPIQLIDPDGRYLISYYYGLPAITMINNLIDMKASNVIGSDKYFHCKANCEASRSSVYGAGAACIISDVKEFYDITFKRFSQSDSDADQFANIYGRRGALTNMSCQAVCSPFRPIGLPEKY